LRTFGQRQIFFPLPLPHRKMLPWNISHL